MSGDSLVSGSFVVADYGVFAATLAVSAAVGFYYMWASRGQESSEDFLTARRSLTAMPISLSMTASFMSSITVLSNPTEVYIYGAILAYVSLANITAMVVTSEIFIPVFYRLAMTSTYEYLELRFNRATRLLGTALFIIQALINSGIIIYGPALAFNQVADMDLWSGIISTGIVCTLYCTLGGLKAVVWTDVFQIGIMISGYLSVIIKALILQGGVHAVISDSKQGGRLNFLDFDINPLRRHTFWTIVFGGAFAWISACGTNQGLVQRYISCKSIFQARVAIYTSQLSICTFLVCSVFAGMCLYSVYKDCDPWTAGLVSAPDQLMPYLVMDIMTDYPGLPGLFFAAVYSGSLSTVSSSINALAAVTLEDLIKPYTKMSEKHLTWASKGLSLFYGVLCIAMAGLAPVLGGMMMQANTISSSMTGGPLLGLFTLGILFPSANSKGALSGLVSGLVVTFCLSLVSLIHPPSPAMTRPLSLTTEGCNFTTTDTLNWTSTPLSMQPAPITTAPVQNSGKHLLGDNWYTPSYLYLNLIGAVTVVSVGLIVSLLTGGWRTRAESRLTLMKEDTTVYHLFKFFKDQVMRQIKSKSEVEKDGKTNPAYCDPETDLVSSSPIWHTKCL